MSVGDPGTRARNDRSHPPAVSRALERSASHGDQPPALPPGPARLRLPYLRGHWKLLSGLRAALAHRAEGCFAALPLRVGSATGHEPRPSSDIDLVVAVESDPRSSRNLNDPSAGASRARSAGRWTSSSWTISWRSRSAWAPSSDRGLVQSLTAPCVWAAAPGTSGGKALVEGQLCRVATGGRLAPRSVVS